MVEEAFFSGGVPLRTLEAWLGEPLDSPNASATVTWDCFGYEKTFRAVHDAASRVAESQRGMVLAALSAASQLHLLTQCRAERVDEERWVMLSVCLKHISEIPGLEAAPGR
ncbi:MAG: hypothetical protein JO225_05895 [Candidatus Eremiobacteraeota bacterium]|nr:hypothetical protein [Candidatus Eremiobacteraeota bacterium]